MPKRMQQDSPRIRKAYYAKMKLVMLELMSVRPYLMADADAATRQEMKDTIGASIVKLESIIRWIDTLANVQKGPRKGSPQRPIPMGSTLPPRPAAEAVKAAPSDIDDDDDDDDIDESDDDDIDESDDIDDNAEGVR